MATRKNEWTARQDLVQQPGGREGRKGLRASKDSFSLFLTLNSLRTSPTLSKARHNARFIFYRGGILPLSFTVPFFSYRIQKQDIHLSSFLVDNIITGNRSLNRQKDAGYLFTVWGQIMTQEAGLAE